LIGQFTLAAALVSHGEKIDHGATGLPLRQVFKKRVEASPVGLAGEELVPIDEVQQRHRLGTHTTKAA